MRFEWVSCCSQMFFEISSFNCKLFLSLTKTQFWLVNKVIFLRLRTIRMAHPSLDMSSRERVPKRIDGEQLERPEQERPLSNRMIYSQRRSEFLLLNSYYQNNVSIFISSPFSGVFLPCMCSQWRRSGCSFWSRRRYHRTEQWWWSTVFRNAFFSKSSFWMKMLIIFFPVHHLWGYSSIAHRTRATWETWSYRQYIISLFTYLVALY